MRLLGIVLLIAGGAAGAAHAADTCMLSQQQMGAMNAADTAKAKINCIYSCPDGKKVTQTIAMQQKTCAKTIPMPK